MFANIVSLYLNKRAILNIYEKHRYSRKHSTNCNVNINITDVIDYRYKSGLLRLHSYNCNDLQESKTALSPK